MKAQCCCWPIYSCWMRDWKRLAGCDTGLETRMAIYSAGHFRPGWVTSANVTPQDALAITLRLGALQYSSITRRKPAWFCCGRLDVLKVTRSPRMAVLADAKNQLHVWHLLWSVIPWHFSLHLMLCNVFCSSSSSSSSRVYLPWKNMLKNMKSSAAVCLLLYLFSVMYDY